MKKTMSVSDLIKELQKYKGDWPVSIWYLGSENAISGPALEVKKVSMGAGRLPIIAVYSEDE